MSDKPEFPPELVARCAEAFIVSWKNDDLSSQIKGVLRASGHAELVAALKKARGIVNDIDVGGTRTTTALAEIDAALRKAGAAP